MSIKGRLETMSLPDVLQWLSMGLKTGTLIITAGDADRKIYFQDGVIISAASSLTTDSLGKFIQRHKELSDETIRIVLAIQKDTSQPFGRLCVNMKIITEEELNVILRRQAESIIFSLFRFSEGEFEFRDGELPIAELIPISLATQNMILEGTRQLDEWRRVQQLIPNWKIIVRLTEQGPAAAEGDELSATEKGTLRLVDGRRTIEEICSISALTDFETCRVLHTLLVKGLLEKAGVREEEEEVQAQQESLAHYLDEVDALLRQVEYRKAAKLLDRTLDAFPGNPDLLRLQSQVQGQLEEDIQRQLGSDESIPVLRVALESRALRDLQLGAQEGFILSRIDGRSSIQELCRVTGVPRQETLNALYELVRHKVVEMLPPAPRVTRKKTPAERSAAADARRFAKVEQYYKDFLAKIKGAPPEQVLGLSPGANATEVRGRFDDLITRYGIDRLPARASDHVRKMSMEIAVILKDAHQRLEQKAEPAKEAKEPGQKTVSDPLKEARLAVNQGNHQRAAEMYGWVLTDRPDHVEAITGRLEAMMQYSRNYAQMENLCRQLLRLKPDSSLGHKYLARVLQLDGRLDEALESAKAAVSISERDPEAQELLNRLKQAKKTKDGLFKRFFV